MPLTEKERDALASAGSNKAVQTGLGGLLTVGAFVWGIWYFRGFLEDTFKKVGDGIASMFGFKSVSAAAESYGYNNSEGVNDLTFQYNVARIAYAAKRGLTGASRINPPGWPTFEVWKKNPSIYV